MGNPWIPIEPWNVVEARMKAAARFEKQQRVLRRAEMIGSRIPAWLLNNSAYRKQYGIRSVRMRAWQLLAAQNAIAMRDSSIARIGLVGYCPPSNFNQDLAKRFIREAYDLVAKQYAGREITLVSGLSDVGMLALGYREAKERGWRTAGIASLKALNYQQFPVDEKEIIGQNWGDESDAFVDNIHALIRVGGGKQSRNEVEQAALSRKPTFEYDLPLLLP